MPTSPNKRKVLSPVDPKNRITAFFKPASSANSNASTPTKQSTTVAPPTNNAAPDDERESSLASDLTSLVTTPTKPSPSPCKSPGTTPRVVPVLQRRNDAPIPAPPALQSRPANTNPSTSFASTSSRTSLPTSSGSRRITKNGEQMVIDSDSDGLDDDSDDLPDLDKLLPSKRRKVTPPTASKTEPAPKDRKELPRSRINFFAPPASPPKARPKYSLASMVKAKQEADKLDARIAEVESGVEAKEFKMQKVIDGEAELDHEMIRDMVDNDSDGADRMIQAMQRTEALENEERFSYFASSEPCAVAFEFPSDCLPDSSWANLLKDEDSRKQASITGFVAELAAKGRLPLDVTRWFAFQLVWEPDPLLCEAYVGILESCIQNNFPVHQSLASLKTFFSSGQEQESQLRSDSQFLATPETSTRKDKIECLCCYTDDDGDTVLCKACNTWQHIACYYPQYDGRKLPKNIKHACVACKPRDVDVEAGRAKQKAKAKAQGRVPSEKRRPLAGLQYVIRVIQLYAPRVGVDIASRAVADLAIAAMDNRVVKNPELRGTINKAIDSLVSTIPEQDEDDVLDYLRERLFDDANVSPTTQCRLVLALPALTQPSHDLRRQLALYCVTGDKQGRALSSPNWPKLIATALTKSKRFSIDDSATDYGHLTDLVGVLDVAIGPGFSATNYPWLAKSLPSSTGTGLFKRDLGPSNEETTFNSQIDNIASKMQSINARIKDMGVTNLKRVEAKSAFESVLTRLRLSVRTTPPPHRDIFDPKGRAKAKDKKGQGALPGFFKRMNEDVTMVDESGG